MLVTLYTNCHVDSSRNALYSYYTIKTCVLAFAFALNFILACYRLMMMML
ncbi:hypothetical protein Hanom_Chr04g00352951 [Helianthus anomalus]